MTNFKTAARKAVATFVFAMGGTLAGSNFFSWDVATWKLAASVGIGALVNLAYRWAEAEVHAHKGH